MAAFQTVAGGGVQSRGRGSSNPGTSTSETGNGGQSGLSDALSMVGNIAGKIWNLPNTLVGIVYGGTGHIVGEIGQAFGLWNQEPSIGFGNNALEFTGNPFGAGGALSLGNTITWGATRGSWFYNYASAHERFHTIQGQFLGPLYIPANLTGMAGSVLSLPFNGTRRTVPGASRELHGRLNFMEGPIFQDRLF